MNSTLREDVLAALFTATSESKLAFVCTLPDGLSLKAVRRGERYLICAWHQDGQRLKALECEEIGEDAGFFEPKVAPWTCAESQAAQLIVEGFQGQLCSHKWDTNLHADAKNEYSNIVKCGACQVVLIDSHSRRGNRHTYSYDTWELRHQIWQRWYRRGPVPGSLQQQAHHVKAQPKSRAKAGGATK